MDEPSEHGLAIIRAVDARARPNGADHPGRPGRPLTSRIEVVTLPVEAVFWYGYALPIPPVLGVLRAALIGAAWSRLRTWGARS